LFAVYSALPRKSLTTLTPRLRIQDAVKNRTDGDAMSRLLSRVPMIVLTGSILAAGAHAQVSASQSVVSSTNMAADVKGPVKPVSPTAADPAEETPDTALDPASLLPDPPKLPAEKAALMGGTIDKLDRVRDQFTLRIFGGGKMKLYFDPRTHIYRNGVAVSVSDLRPGDRISVDTILDGSTVFARNIRLKNTLAASESQGAVVSYRADKGELLVRDVLSPEPLKLRVTPDTRLIQGGHPVAASELAAGTLVAVQFASQRDGHNVAQEISILAVPGTGFTFAGRVTALDLSSGLLVITSTTDGKTYEIHLDPSAVSINDNLRLSANVTVLTRFDGTRYEAQTLTVNPQNQQ
jgi:hypothetical protein